MTDIHISSHATPVAVDHGNEWQPMDTCPRGVKVQLLGKGGVAIYGIFHTDPFWEGWAPLPCRPKEKPCS